MSNWENVEFGNLDADWSERIDNYVARGKARSKIHDFSTKLKTNELMRFEIVDELNFDLPGGDESLFFITSKTLSLLDVLNYIENKKRIDKVIMFLFTLNKKGADYIVSLSERCHVKIIISDIMNSKRDKERLITKSLERGVEIAFCHSHAKIISISTKDGNKYNLVGSMNSGSNAKIENLQIINSEDMFSFIESSYEEMKKEYSIEKRYEK